MSDEQIKIAVDIEGDSVEIEREQVETIRVTPLFRPVENGDCNARLGSGATTPAETATREAATNTPTSTC
jgi:hypothetical protein